MCGLIIYKHAVLSRSTQSRGAIEHGPSLWVEGTMLLSGLQGALWGVACEMFVPALRLALSRTPKHSQPLLLSHCYYLSIWCLCTQLAQLEGKVRHVWGRCGHDFRKIPQRRAGHWKGSLKPDAKNSKVSHSQIITFVFSLPPLHEGVVRIKWNNVKALRTLLTHRKPSVTVRCWCPC